ncbi:hypothetical protein METHPM2_1070022 [Pseudomonas sp. PM2]
MAEPIANSGCPGRNPETFRINFAGFLPLLKDTYFDQRLYSRPGCGLCLPGLPANLHPGRDPGHY